MRHSFHCLLSTVKTVRWDPIQRDSQRTERERERAGSILLRRTQHGLSFLTVSVSVFQYYFCLTVTLTFAYKAKNLLKDF